MIYKYIYVYGAIIIKEDEKKLKSGKTWKDLEGG